MSSQISSALLERNHLSGHVIKSSLPQGTLVQEFRSPFKIRNAKDLIHLLFWLHRQKGLYPRRIFNTYYNEARKFIREVGLDNVESMMLEAAKVAKYPWGFGFVRKLGGGS